MIQWTLSNGHESTLGRYVDLCTAVFGAESAATKYLRIQLAKYSLDYEVRMCEESMMRMLTSIHAYGDL